MTGKYMIFLKLKNLIKTIMDTVEYLNPQKTLVIFNNYKYNLHQTNKNGTERWRCESCKSMSITVDQNGSILRKPNVQEMRHNPRVCRKMCEISLQCYKNYEILKYESGQKSKFSFANRYREMLLQLQGNYDPRLVSDYFPNEAKARVTCARIRRRNHPNQANVTKLTLNNNETLKLEM